jgi:hypothetical protein
MSRQKWNGRGPKRTAWECLANLPQPESGRNFTKQTIVLIWEIEAPDTGKGSES